MFVYSTVHFKITLCFRGHVDIRSVGNLIILGSKNTGESNLALMSVK